MNALRNAASLFAPLSVGGMVSSVLAAIGGWFDAYFAGVAMCSCFLGGFAAVGLFATTAPKGGDR